MSSNACRSGATSAAITPPDAPQRPFTRVHHGDELVDEYAWMSDLADPEMVAYLTAENAYADAVTAHLEPLREAIFTEIKDRSLETDLSVPTAYRGWWYYSRTQEGKQYPTQCRMPVVPGRPRPAMTPDADPPADEQAVVDANAEAEGHDFFSLGASEVELSGDRVAYTVDLAGDERFALRVRVISTGELVDDAVRDMGYGLAWSADGAHLFYTRVDEAWRPFEVWRHEVGRSGEEDMLVYTEPDERFWMSLGASRDERFLQIGIGSKNTSEVRLLDLADPFAMPRVVAPRREGVEYDVEPAGDRLLIVHNVNRPDFEIAWAPLDATSADQWQPWLVPGAGERVSGVDAFAGHAVISMRRGGLSGLAIAARAPQAAIGFAVPEPLGFDEEVYSVGLGANPEWRTDAVQIVFESLVTPRTVLECHLDTKERTVLKQQPVLGGYDPARYVQRRIWVTAEAGTRVPISLVARADVPTDATAPGLLYGYGAYEISLDPWFSIARLSLLDRGVVYAIAHVRGGGELGRAWYDQGRLEHKENSFSDLVSCARALGEQGWVDPDRLALQGGSAGGLLVGAALNAAPEEFAVCEADVPFVDPLTTILDPSLPLTVTEWEEWGNPLADPEAYARMKRYSPYQNVREVRYPAILATTSLKDTRVSCTEPAKWVARLRDRATNDPAVRPILLRTEMNAGHGGRSGRYDAWREVAWETAFVLDRLGVGPAGDGDLTGPV